MVFYFSFCSSNILINLYFLSKIIVKITFNKNTLINKNKSFSIHICYVYEYYKISKLQNSMSYRFQISFQMGLSVENLQIMLN